MKNSENALRITEYTIVMSGRMSYFKPLGTTEGPKQSLGDHVFREVGKFEGERFKKLQDPLHLTLGPPLLFFKKAEKGSSMKEIAQIAVEAATRAGHLIAADLGKAMITLKDSTYNLVTDADRRSEELIAGFLLKEMPGSSCLGEETHHAALNADRLWIVDPLDGTTNFAHGIPHFGVSVAYAEKGTILAGAVYDPMRSELFSATLGQGATLNGAPIHVSGNRQLTQSIIGTGFYYDRGETMEKTLGALHTLFKQNIHCLRGIGASSLDLTWLAAGRFDGDFEYTLSPWDFAAGLLILTEAGGKAIDARTAAPAALFSNGLICSNGLIHDALVACTLNAPRYGSFPTQE